MSYRYCSNCGRKISKSTKFCPYCGAKQGISHIKHHTNLNFNINKRPNNQLKGSLHKIGNFFSSRIYHIPTTQFSSSRLHARKIVSNLVAIILLITYGPIIFISGKSSIGMLISLILMTIAIIAVGYFIARLLFNVQWHHFWKTWSIKKIIVIAIVLICIGGVAYSTHDDTSNEQIEEFKKSAGNNQWRIGVGNYNDGKLQTQSTNDTYSINNGTITDNSDNNQANYHIDGDTITLSNLNNAVSGMDVPYNQLVNNSNNDQSTKATASNDLELVDLARKMFKQPSDNDVVVFKADSGQGISGHNLIVFIKA